MLDIANSVDPDNTATLRYTPLNIHENLVYFRLLLSIIMICLMDFVVYNKSLVKKPVFGVSDTKLSRISVFCIEAAKVMIRRHGSTDNHIAN